VKGNGQEPILDLVTASKRTLMAAALRERPTEHLDRSLAGRRSYHQSHAATWVLIVSTAKPPRAHRGGYDHHIRGIDLRY
jgi:hypothetical protein